jgi:hypothetical protein
MRSDSMQLQYAKRLKMYYFSYLSTVFYCKDFVCKRYFEAQAGYLLGKAVLWRVYILAIFPTGHMASR